MPRWAVAALLAAAVVIIGLLVTVIVLLTGGRDDAPRSRDSASSATEPPAEAKTFNVRGDITLIDSGVNKTASECWGTGGYDDMTGGTQVVIKDASGTSVAVGQLNPGAPENSVTCRFDFIVEGVPVGSSVYSVEVSHRGSFSFSQDQAQSLHLSLG